MTTVRELRTSPEVGGVGHSVLRKEDDRFIRGAGNYLDDLTFPACCTWLSCGPRGSCPDSVHRLLGGDGPRRRAGGRYR